MNSGPRFLYKIVLVAGNDSTEIDWGNHPSWQKDHADELESATVIWLIPKEKPSKLRNVSVKLGDGRRWILFSRVYGTTSAGLDKQVRIYAIGWQETLESGVNKKSMIWIYPSGEVEVSEEPSYAAVFLNMVQSEG